MIALLHSTLSPDKIPYLVCTFQRSVGRDIAVSIIANDTTLGPNPAMKTSQFYVPPPWMTFTIKLGTQCWVGGQET